MRIFKEKLLEIKEWFKENQKNIFLALLIILVVTLSFGLGYLTNRELNKNNRAPIIIEKCGN